MQVSGQILGKKVESVLCVECSGVSDSAQSLDILRTSNFDTTNNAIWVLNKIRKKYVKNVVIGHLNINSLANKFDALTLIIKDRLDILVLVETKLDDSFTDRKFIIEGYKNNI